MNAWASHDFRYRFRARARGRAKRNCISESLKRDATPLSADERRVLASRRELPGRRHRDGGPLAVGYDAVRGRPLPWSSRSGGSLPGRALSPRPGTPHRSCLVTVPALFLLPPPLVPLAIGLALCRRARAGCAVGKLGAGPAARGRSPCLVRHRPRAHPDRGRRAGADGDAGLDPDCRARPPKWRLDLASISARDGARARD